MVSGGVAAAMTVLRGGDEPGPTAEPDPDRPTGTVSTDFDAACSESPDLTEAECTLRNDVLAAGWPVDPADCKPIEADGAQLAIECPALAAKDSDLAPDGGVRIFGYGDTATMDDSFTSSVTALDLDGPIDLEGGEEGWGRWNYQGVEEAAGKVLLHYNTERARSYVAWTDESINVEMWAGHEGEILADMHDWWANA